MEDDKNTKIHSVLKYGRPLICFLFVVSFIFVYCIHSYADSSDVTFVTRYGIDTSEDYAFYYRFGISAYSASGNDSSLLFSMNSNPIRTSYISSFGTWYNDFMTTYAYPSSVVINSVTYDLSSCYTIINSSGSAIDSQGRSVKYIVAQGYTCIVNNYIVSASPFSFIYRTNTDILVNNVNTQSSNGYYCLALTDYASGNMNYVMAFTDLDVFMSSSDGASGFTNFSTTSTDFDIDSTENFNFNNLKKDGLIINSGDPVIPEESETIGQYYTYCGIDAYFSSGTAQSVLLNYTVSPNEYMRLHPSEYDVMIEVSAVITTSGSDHPNIPLTYSNSYMQGLETYINSASNPNLQIWFDDLVSAQSNDSLADALKSWWGDVTNSDTQYYNPNGSVVSFGGASASGGTRSLGGYSLNPNLKISDIVFQCSIRVEYNQSDPRQVSGVYRWQQGLISGSRTQLENTISNNYNPPESYSPQYPATLRDSQGNIVVGGTTVNPVIYNNLNAAVEYLFNVDASDYLNIVGNTHSAIQETFNTLTNTSQNGAWAIMEQSYALIPDEIWDWIKSAVAVILGGSIISWVMYFRVKKG